ncbi:MAG: class I SAM-dependent rRNA methyltransferase [Paludibacteraceae bacterium]|nr:class I SAM-dependent rRNA methyltransferase [Paludibacteraceae bacterium]
MITITLKSGKEDNIRRFHPWIFSGAIKKFSAEPEEGELVRVESSNHEFLALGHYQIGSIAVRILSFTDCPIDRAFYKTKIEAAATMRRAMGLPDEQTNSYRLVHGEGDGLPGMVVDIYNNTAVFQAHSIGIHLIREMLAELITETVNEVTKVYYKSEGTMPHKAKEKAHDGYIIGNFEPTDNIATENGLRFHADWREGQKTGFFLDQRENRSLLEHYSNGRNVLNMFCYTGGFSFYALRGGAKMVHSVDASDKAINLVKKNIELNFGNEPRHEAFATDAFKFMDSIDDRYDLIILDPPAFAKHRDALHNALVGYRRLNALAFKKIRKGGILFTFSCSQAVNREQFRLAVFSAAAMSGRHVRILHQLTQPIDHPVNIYHPEGEYLKGLVLYVE